MVINTNMSGTAGTPLVKSNARPDSNSKTGSPSDSSSGQTGAATLDSQINRAFLDVGSTIQSGDAAVQSTQLARANMLNQPGTAMLAQANLSPETVLNLLQE
ncbi:MAG TPA: flagellin [Candidatus Baltobacteraceae bacterium]|jgi:flagellin-like hook-associated protein FlgL|nr:flagellin [Candidatus Baltobacteraceae bacterium]